MKTLLIVDHSISSTGGHHLEYAKRVADGARSEGFRVVLLANKKFVGKDGTSCFDEVHARHRFGFWEYDRLEAGVIEGAKTLFQRRLLRSAFASRLWQRMRLFLGAMESYAWAFSPPASIASILFDRKGPRSSISSVPMTLVIWVASLVNKVKLFRHRLNPRRLKAWEIFWRCVRLVSLLLVSPLLLLRLLFYACIKTLALLSFALRGISNYLHARVMLHNFRSAIASVMRHIEGETVIFIPTLGCLEMLSLLGDEKLLRTKNTTWHLLFRRDWPSSDARGVFWVSSFLKAQRLRIENLHFYTDTELLTKSYAKHTNLGFSTLPIPSDTSVSRVPSDARDRSAFSLVYLGDARDEKGYWRLPCLVQDLSSAIAGELRGAPVQFLFQSNFNSMLGEPRTRVARAELRAISNKYKVQLNEEPMASDQYTDVLSNTDVMLIPYDEVNYSERSSGVFAESLAVGAIPVVPEWSWMDQCMAREIYFSLAENVGQLDSLCLSRDRGEAEALTWYVTAADLTRFLFLSCQVRSNVSEQDGVQRLALQVEVTKRRSGTFICEFSIRAWVSSDLALAAFDIPESLLMAGGHELTLKVSVKKGSDRKAPIVLLPTPQSRLYFDNCAISHSGPICTYSNQRVGSLAASVTRLAKQFEMYANECEHVTSKWRATHSGRLLVRALQREVS